MNLEVEPAGAPAAAVAAPAHTCANCGAGISQNYCPACGQSAHIHSSLLHLGEEVLHGLLHLDAKGWRTLPMLVRHPGQLTRRYVDGQRTRYVSPLILFLFMMFLLFFVVSATTSSDGALSTQESRAKTRITHQQALDQATRALAAAEATGSAVAEARAGQLAAHTRLAQYDAATRQAFPAEGSPEAARQFNLNKALASSSLVQYFPSLGRLKRAGENVDLTLYKLKNTAYKFAFLLLPISLPFMWLLFLRRRDVTMYDHAVFTLYSISFMSLLFAVLAVSDYFGLDLLTVALFLLVPPVHMFAQLRGTYALGPWATLWRTAILLAVAGIVFLLFLVLVLALTIL